MNNIKKVLNDKLWRALKEGLDHVVYSRVKRYGQAASKAWMMVNDENFRVINNVKNPVRNSLIESTARVGLFFGSFNPLTNAHVALAKGAVRSRWANEVWFVLSPANPAKVGKNVLADEEHRRNMMRIFLAKEDDPSLSLCEIEYDMPRPSYTHRTLEVLRARNPKTDFRILCGSDTLSKMLSWKNGDTLLKENRFICHMRGDDKPEWSEEVMKRVEIVEMDVPEISSTLVRGNISQGIAYNHLIPDSIAGYIKQNDLYR